MEKLAKFLYGWLLDGTEAHSTYFTNEHGWYLCFIMMLGVALIATLYYYFVVATKVNKATKENYLWIWIFGYIVLFFFTPLVFQLKYRNDGCSIWDFPLLFVYIGLLNAAYYTIVFQLLSSVWCTTKITKANNITLFTLFK